MKKLSLIATILVMGISACKKHKDTTPPPQQDLWPTAMGNTWAYKVTSYTASGASIDDGIYTITIDATKTVGGKTYYGTAGQNMYYENESNRLYETDSNGSFTRLLAKSVENTDTIFKGDATYTIGTTEYSGTLARVAFAYGTVIEGYTCVQITDLYTNTNGKLGKKVVAYYSPGTGPVSFLYYTNPEHPNSDSVYRTKGYVLDSHTLY